MSPIKPITSILACFLALQAQAAEPAKLVFCYEDQDSWPWVMLDDKGLNQALFDRVQSALKLTIERQPMPWKRCLDGLARGQYDGAFASSFKAERQVMGHYPYRADGSLDTDKRLHSASYSLYRLRGSQADWDGNTFTGIQGRVASLSGFSIIDFLKAHGLDVEETSRDPLALLRMLHGRRFEAAAMQTLRADQLLASHPDLGEGIEKRPVPLEQKDYYLMLSNRLMDMNPSLAHAIWDEVARQRESADYQAQLKQVLAATPHGN
ncbi:transporter substrate-binding domain-containing protein [Aquipseudomonas alcaligenes]|uniref:Transporter substrate-binding domain-containing protein n=1 Tax=Pseudomonas solani TaxID=2731552 RepID=A0AAU7XXW0_9PSED